MKYLVIFDAIVDATARTLRAAKRKRQQLLREYSRWMPDAKRFIFIYRVRQIKL